MHIVLRELIATYIITYNTQQIIDNIRHYHDLLLWETLKVPSLIEACGRDSSDMLLVIYRRSTKMLHLELK